MCVWKDGRVCVGEGLVSPFFIVVCEMERGLHTLFYLILV